MIAPNPGIHEGVLEADYHAWNAMSSTVLKLFDRSPAHAREQMLNPSEETAAKAYGSAIHTAVLEPEEFEKRYILSPFENQRRLKRDAETWAEFDEGRKGRAVLRPSEWEGCHEIQEQVYRHPLASKLLTQAARKELSITWDCPHTGLRCKARLDAFTEYAGWTVAVDVKSTASDARRDAWERAVSTFDYHIQAGFYMNGLDVLAPMERRWFWIVFEKDAPYGCRVYEIAEGALRLGRRRADEFMQLYKVCVDSGEWSNYPTELEIAGLPPWRMSREVEYEDAEESF